MTLSRSRGAALIASATLVVAACNTAPRDSGPAPAATADPGEVARRIEEYFAKSVTPGMALKAGGIVASGVPGWNRGTLDVDANGSKQSLPFLVSPDGRYFISGEITDLTVDPLQATMAKSGTPVAKHYVVTANSGTVVTTAIMNPAVG